MLAEYINFHSPAAGNQKPRILNGKSAHTGNECRLASKVTEYKIINHNKGPVLGAVRLKS